MRPYVQARRAAEAEVGAERFDPVEVFERDNWVCGLCGRGTDRTAVFPHPASPSLDHIIPLARRGEHTKANTRCTHLICNLRKGDRPTVAEA
ncbi:HNH endonuclease [Kitasatospora sp. NPDC058478]|uniref:HNH endonuclease n=1 Tax=unclassified Kitasatospora TaxID=2633591 RepID=UPI00365ED4F3